jgi:CHAD domain-containing protein
MNPAVLTVRLLALLEKVSARAGTEDVHRLRTTVRRLEVQLGSLPAGGANKVAKSLKALRRKAGKVRDLDVHLGLLKPSLLAPSPSRRHRASGAPGAVARPRSQPQDELRQILQHKRARQLVSLRALVAAAAPLLESRLPALVERRPPAKDSPRDALQQSARARRRFLQWTRDIPGDEQELHQLRIRTKKLRYSLEPLEACKEAAALVAKLKQVQDAIGTWHDWFTLEQLAVRYLDSADAAPARDALHAHCQREYRRARRTAQNVRSWMSDAQNDAQCEARPPASGAAPSPRLIRKAG